MSAGYGTAFYLGEFLAMNRQAHPGIVIVGDHSGVCDALAILLEENAIAVLGQAKGKENAQTLISSERPDAVLVDLSSVDDCGLDLVADLCGLDIPVVVCSTSEEPENVQRVMDAGACAYMSTRDAGLSLAHTILDVMNG